MAMQSNLKSTFTFIEGKQKLPFQLVLLTGYRKNKIPITKLTTNPKKILENMYEIVEFDNLEIFLETNIVDPVHINWGNVIEKEDDTNINFQLDNENNTYSIYLIEESGNDYPWRCGNYHFEVTFNNQVYYGGFKIVPRNIDEQQFNKIHEYINSHLEGLAIDYISYKRTYTNLVHLESSSHWQFIQWYKKVEKKLHQSLNMIENNTQNKMEKYYLIEKEPKHYDNKSIRWENTPKGQSLKGNGYLNRKLILSPNSNSNRLIKFRIRLLTSKIKKAVITINQVLEKMENQLREVNEDVLELNTQVKRIETSSRVTSREKKRMSNTLISKEIEKKEIEQSLSNLYRMQTNLTRSINLLYNRLSSEFWTRVSDRPPKNIQFEKFIGYQIFQQIWNQYKNNLPEESNNTIEVPVYRPTYELYEYYVLLGVLNVLEDLGFSTHKDSVREQLTTTFYESGLIDGTTVKYENNNRYVEVIYEGLLEHNETVAIEKNAEFFSFRNHRKPDIRLVLYLKNYDKLIYHSSFIIEVKYSPLINILNSFGNTKAMEQMNDYWDIIHIEKYNKEVNYIRDSVKQVVCIYPGDNNSPIIKNTPSGDFLQYYPNKKSNDVFEVFGKDELKVLIENWLGLTDVYGE